MNVLNYRWLYLANKKHAQAESTENNKESNDNVENKQEKAGIDNKAFEAGEIKHINDNKYQDNSSPNTVNENIDNVNQSQIEMGFTESMICTSKL